MNTIDILDDVIGALIGAEKDRKRRKARRRLEVAPDIERQREILNKLPKICETDFVEQEKPASSISKYRKNFQKKYPLKAKAHKLVQQKLITGAIRKRGCETCGAKKDVHAHHDDYSRPLSVRWLCRKHHQEWHADNKAKYEASWEKSAQKVRKTPSHS